MPVRVRRNVTLVLLLLWLCSLRPAVPTGSTDDVDVVVIGAGISGLAAARALHDHGYKTIVLERLPFLGGNVRTETMSTDDRLFTVEHGAQWIHHSTGNPFFHIAQDLGLGPGTIPDSALCLGAAEEEGWGVYRRCEFDRILMYSGDGRILTQQERDSISFAVERGLKGADRVAELGDSVQDAIDRYFEEKSERREGGEKTSHDWERRAVQWHLEVLMEHDIGESPRNLPFEDGDDEYEDYGGLGAIVPGGIRRVIDGLASPLEVRVGAGWAVEGIGYDMDDGVVVTTAGGHAITAGAVVVTAPLESLRKLRFAPALPKRKANAIARMRMGLLNKLFLCWREQDIFWPLASYQFGVIDRRPEEMMLHTFVNLLLYEGAPCLVFPIGGDHGRSAESLGEEAITRRAMRLLRRLYGDHIASPRTTRLVGWGRAAGLSGSYTVVAGGQAGLVRALGRSVAGRVYFAGESTHPLRWASMHGALETGFRAASDIISGSVVSPGNCFQAPAHTCWAVNQLEEPHLRGQCPRSITERYLFQWEEETVVRTGQYPVAPSSQPGDISKS